MRSAGPTVIVSLMLGCGGGSGTGSGTGTDTGTGPGTSGEGTDTIGFSTGGSGEQPTTGGPSTGATDTAVVPTGTGEPGTGDTTTSTGDTTTSTGTTGPDDTGETADDTTAGPALCGMNGPDIDIILEHDGEDLGCEDIEFIGSRPLGDQPGPVFKLDGCPCGSECEQADPWTLTIEAPGDLMPLIQDCPQIVVQREMTPNGCEMTGAWISDGPGPDLNVGLGWWTVGRTFEVIDRVGPELEFSAIPVEVCECADCCEAPTRFDLQFTFNNKTVTIPEGGQDHIERGGSFTFHNFQSHTTGICEDPPAVAWLISNALVPP